MSLSSKTGVYYFYYQFQAHFLAYVFNAYGIKELSASVAGAYIYSQPVFAVAIAMIFLKEELSLIKLVAAILIFAGVFLSNKKSRKLKVDNDTEGYWLSIFRVIKK